MATTIPVLIVRAGLIDDRQRGDIARLKNPADPEVHWQSVAWAGAGRAFERYRSGDL
jgi:hypothetical protein